MTRVERPAMQSTTDRRLIEPALRISRIGLSGRSRLSMRRLPLRREFPQGVGLFPERIDNWERGNRPIGVKRERETR